MVEKSKNVTAEIIAKTKRDKVGGKKPVTYTVNLTVLKEFYSFCKKQNLNKSQVIEELLIKFLQGELK